MAIPRNLANLANQLNTDGEAPKIEVGNSSVVVTDTGSNGTIAFTTDGSERMRVNSSGTLLINTTSAATGTNTQYALAQIVGNNAGGANYGAIDISRNEDSSSITVDENIGMIHFGDRQAGEYAQIRVAADGTAGSGDYPGRMAFFTTSDGAATPTERARITSGGFFKASNTGTYSSPTGLHHELRVDATNNNVAYFVNSAASSPYGTATRFTGATPNNTTNYFEYYDDSTNLKAVLYSDGSWQVRANSYGGISDVKLKQDIVDANSQWNDIKGLRIRKYRFKDEVAADPDYPSHLGVIAQEAELVSPGLVFESPDVEEVEVPVLDDEGNPVLDESGEPQTKTERRETGEVTKGVKYSILYMKAVKALQEAMERIETLEAKVAALEAQP